MLTSLASAVQNLCVWLVQSAFQPLSAGSPTRQPVLMSQGLSIRGSISHFGARMKGQLLLKDAAVGEKSAALVWG